MKIITLNNSNKLEFSDKVWNDLKKIAGIESPLQDPAKQKQYETLLGQLRQLFPDIASKLENGQISIEQAKQELTATASSNKIIVIAGWKENVQKGLAILTMMSGLGMEEVKAQFPPGARVDNSVYHSQLINEQRKNLKEQRRREIEQDLEPNTNIASGEDGKIITNTFIILKVFPESNIVLARLNDENLTSSNDTYYYIKRLNHITESANGQLLPASIKPSNETFKTSKNAYRLFEEINPVIATNAPDYKQKGQSNLKISKIYPEYNVILVTDGEQFYFVKRRKSVNVERHQIGDTIGIQIKPSNQTFTNGNYRLFEEIDRTKKIPQTVEEKQKAKSQQLQDEFHRKKYR